MPETYRHLTIARQQPVTERRGRGGGPRVPKRDDPVAHATRIDAEVDLAEAAPAPSAAFDPRLLLKLDVRGLDPNDLELIQGFEVVSQEQNTLVALFASNDALREFKRRLALIRAGTALSRSDILYAIESVSTWSADDRRGHALRTEGLPRDAKALVDVELWPLERVHERDPLCAAFEKWAAEQEIRVLDKVLRAAVIMYRVEASPAQVEKALLLHRDVRTVDLPPRYRLEVSVLETSLAELGAIPAPAEDAPRVVVLDSGIVANHPLLGPAVGDAQSFLEGHDESDGHGHGTAVAGLALYHDIAACAEKRSFVPELRVLSGRVLDDTGHNTTGFLENQIADAVGYFVDHYGARVFNVSVGDDRKPYVGGHVRGLAVTLDELARAHDILFVVPAGNYGAEEEPVRWRTQYPRYLLERPAARLIDPAPAINVLTVGGLARYEASRAAQRHANDPAQQCVARAEQPSPFTRTGPGAARAIKPELVEFAGNYAVDMRDGGDGVTFNALMGELSLNHAFAMGNLFVDRNGTSFSAPKIAHLAAKLLVDYPNASANALRALLLATAEIPEATRALKLEDEDLLRLVGYGRPDGSAARYSTERRVTLFAEESIGENAHHFYEVPLPEQFVARGQRDRAITVALAHMPIVRTTRVDYRASKFAFHLVPAKSLEEVTRVFRRTRRDAREDMIKEVRTPDVGSTARGRGTVQRARYELKRVSDDLRNGKLFLVVTRQVPAWAAGMVADESYAVVVALEDRSANEVQLYSQVQNILRQRVRQRA